jgi:hypothetical protein
VKRVTLRRKHEKMQSENKKIVKKTLKRSGNSRKLGKFIAKPKAFVEFRCMLTKMF